MALSGNAKRVRMGCGHNGPRRKLAAAIEHLKVDNEALRETILQKDRELRLQSVRLRRLNSLSLWDWIKSHVFRKDIDNVA